jgi:Xaa-Pro dipeptidase
MDEAGLDLYVSFDPSNVYYLTNFANHVHERPFVLVIGKDGPPRFVVPHLEEPHVLARAVCELELVRYLEFPAPEGERWSDRFRSLIPATARVGVESVCPLQIYDETPGERVRTDIIDDVRMIKSDYEIGRIVHACKIMNAGYERLLDLCKPGSLAIELYGDVSRAMTQMMLSEIPNANMVASEFYALVQPPSLSHDPHNFTDIFVQLVEGGPHVSIVAGKANGYGAEVERTFFLGSVPDEAKDPFDAMLECRRVAYEMTKPGVVMGEVDQAVRDVLERRGYADKILHRTGHSFGVTGHEAPFLAIGYNRVIEPGMVFSIEPGIYLPGIGGFRHSDTVLITNDGNLCLTEAPETLGDLTYPN